MATLQRRRTRRPRSYGTSRAELSQRQRVSDAARKYEGKHVRLDDYGDLALLHMVDDNEREPSVTFAEILEVEPRSVGCRFSWLRRMGYLTLVDGRLWVLSRRGKALLGNRERIELIQSMAREARRNETLTWVAGREFRRNFAGR